jgi:hypothetical protein
VKVRESDKLQGSDAKHGKLRSNGCDKARLIDYKESVKSKNLFVQVCLETAHTDRVQHQY